jgi:hypothetical protein
MGTTTVRCVRVCDGAGLLGIAELKMTMKKWRTLLTYVRTILESAAATAATAAAAATAATSAVAVAAAARDRVARIVTTIQHAKVWLFTSCNCPPPKEIMPFIKKEIGVIVFMR